MYAILKMVPYSTTYHRMATQNIARRKDGHVILVVWLIPIFNISSQLPLCSTVAKLSKPLEGRGQSDEAQRGERVATAQNEE